MKIYLAGPMTGYPQFNFPAFESAAKTLRQQGHIVFSPREADAERHGKNFGLDNKIGNPQAEEKHGFNLREALATDLKWICEHADAIACLPGWEHSTGSGAEWATAKALKLKFIYL